jgi:hypothetical protein
MSKSKSSSDCDVHWLIKLAQEIREGGVPRVSPGELLIDPDLRHPALSTLGELIDGCGSEISPISLDGYAYGLKQAGLIDDVVLQTVRMHIGEVGESDQSSSLKRKH